MIDLFGEVITVGITFEDFWAAWPKGFKAAPKKAAKCWAKLQESEKAAVMEDLEYREQRDKKWVGNSNGDRWIPNPTTYLNQGRWMDDYEECRPVSQTTQPTIIDRITDTNW